MRVLVTGGTGFIGSHAVEALLASGHQVRLLARSLERADTVLAGRGLLARVRSGGDIKGDIEIAKGDIVDAPSVRSAMVGCNAVVHAAAVVGIDGNKAAAVRATNELGTRNVLGAAVELGLDPIVYLSSISALFRPGGPVLLTRETRVADPKSPYARSKAACERYARALQAQGHPVVCIYPGGVLGPDDPGLSEVMRAAIIWRRLTMVSLDTGFLLVDVRDIATVIAASITPHGGPRRFLAGHHYVAWPELCRMVAEVTGRPVLHPRVPAPVVRALGRGGDAVHHLIPFSFPLSREAMETATRMVPMQDQETIDELAVSFRPPEETLHDAYRWLYDTGRIPAWLVPAVAQERPGA